MKNFKLDPGFHGLDLQLVKLLTSALIQELFIQNKIFIKMEDSTMFKLIKYKRKIMYKRIKNVGKYIYEYHDFIWTYEIVEWLFMIIQFVVALPVISRINVWLLVVTRIVVWL